MTVPSNPDEPGKKYGGDRIRSDRETNLSREILDDLTVNLNLYSSYDSKPPVEGSILDYSIVFGIKYTFSRGPAQATAAIACGLIRIPDNKPSRRTDFTTWAAISSCTPKMPSGAILCS